LPRQRLDPAARGGGPQPAPVQKDERPVPHAKTRNDRTVQIRVGDFPFVTPAPPEIAAILGA